MSDTTKNTDGELVVLAGSVTVKRKVGAGEAWVDVAQGEPVGDLDDETRERLLASGAIGRRDGQPYVPTARPVPGLVEPDEINRDVVPAGSAEDILAWVGDDLARARVAADMERAKGLNARSGLLAELENVKAAEETEPPKVPEHYDENTAVSPAPSGGVVVPDEGADVGDKPAERPARKATGRRQG